MRKLWITLFAGALMLGQIVASQAVSFTVVTTGGNWVDDPNTVALEGIQSDNARYLSILFPQASGVGAESAVSFGKTISKEQTNPPIRPSQDTFNGWAGDFSVWFEFQVTEIDSNVTHTYLVQGHFVGINNASPQMTVNAQGFGESKVAFETQKVTVDGSQVFTQTEASPTGIQSVKTKMDFGGVPVIIWIDLRDQLPPPGDFGGELSVGGFIRAQNAVPEPGAMALLLGAGVSGSLLFFRRRRK